jgi:hypothetical protein
MGIPLDKIPESMRAKMENAPSATGLSYTNHKEMKALAVKKCREHGLVVITSREDKRTTIQKGALDLIIMGNQRVALADLKFGKDQPSEDQLAFVEQCKRANVPTGFFWSVWEFWEWVGQIFNL